MHDSWLPRSPTKTSRTGFRTTRSRPARARPPRELVSLPPPPVATTTGRLRRHGARRRPADARARPRVSRTRLSASHTPGCCSGGPHGLGGGHAGARCRATASARGHPTSGTPAARDGGPARGQRALGWPEHDRLIAVIPGVIAASSSLPKRSLPSQVPRLASSLATVCRIRARLRSPAARPAENQTASRTSSPSSPPTVSCA